MKKLLIFSALATFLLAQERFSKIELPIKSSADYQRIAELGIAVDHYEGKIGEKISVYLSESELRLLDHAGIHYSILIKDWQQYYSEQQKLDQYSPAAISADDPKYFRYGSMGGFLVYDEVVQQLDSMKLLFPHLISTMDTIGTSVEGRILYAVKISDNPEMHESEEPEVLYTALHHAREPQGMMTVIYYMWWLLERYGKDPSATYLVNHRQMWFIPVVNPDGYTYNQSMNPNGGFMWRKNRRDNKDGSFGIDLNRNYGPYDMWNAPNGGSSTASNSDTYRGPSPFSEPETYALSEFAKSHNIKTCFNYHTYSNLLIYPWGYSSKESDDSLLFRQWTFDMSSVNRYAIGTDLQTVGYSTRGNSDDFFYGDSSKPRTYAMTPEVGTTGFWPVKSLIYPLAQENLLQNKLLAYYAGAYPAVRSFEKKSGSITLRLVNKGLSELPNTTLFLTTNSGIISPSIQTGTIPSFQTKEVTFNYSPLVTDGPSAVQSKIFLFDSTKGFVYDSITFISGSPALLFSDSAQSTSQWSTGSSWGIITDETTSNTIFTDSPNGKYSANSDNSLTLLTPIDLTDYQFAELSLKTHWAIESTWDFATIEVSTNLGISWTSVKTPLSRKGSGRSGSKQPSTAIGYDAFTPGLDWITQTADLSSFAGKNILLRFRLAADGGDERDGWYVDDISVTGYKSTPNAVSHNTLPYTYSLSQNYPNPFNPSTTFNFSIEKAGLASLIIYNTLGQQLAVALQQELTPGNYSVNFQAGQLSSGVYFYRFISGTYSAIKKMTVVK